MKHLKYFFTALAVISILCSCTETNAPQTKEDTKEDTKSDPETPTKVTTAKITFNNQSEDTYTVNIQSYNFSDQFNISGNTNKTKTYSLSSVIGYMYNVTITQKDGYVVYPTEHFLRVELMEEGEVICWNNDKYWLR